MTNNEQRLLNALRKLHVLTRGIDVSRLGGAVTEAQGEAIALISELEERRVFKNKHFTKRNYETSNIVACVAETAPDENYIPADESILEKLTMLWIQGGVRFYGYL